MYVLVPHLNASRRIEVCAAGGREEGVGDATGCWEANYALVVVACALFSSRAFSMSPK